MGQLSPRFRMICQRRDQWCWAAVSAAVREFPPPVTARSQCAIATAVLPGGLRCCPDPDSCDFPFSLREALASLGKLLLFIDNQVDFDVIEDQINARNRPVCARVEIDDDGNGSVDRAHFVVIVACKKARGVPRVSVMDPAGGQEGIAAPIEANINEMSFAQFARRYRMIGTWRQTYLVK